MSADNKLKAYIDRILRCREAEDAAKEDTKAVYKDLAAEGYEKAVVGQVVTYLRKREKDGDKLNELSAKFDLYLSAYESPSHAYARARDGEDVNPRLIKQVVDGVQTQAGRAALIAAVDIMIEREEAETESPRKAAEAVSERTATGQAAGSAFGLSENSPETADETVGGFPVAAAPTSAEETGAIQSTRQGAGMERGMYPGVTGGESAASFSPETATETPKQVYGDSGAAATALPSQSVNIPAGGDHAQKIDGSDELCPAELNSPETAEGPKVLDGRSPVAGESRHHCDVSEDEAGQNLTGNSILTASDQPLEGGDDEEVAHHPAAQAETIVLESVSAAPRAAYNLRPNCLKPTNCAGHGSRHCHACTVAARESEEA